MKIVDPVIIVGSGHAGVQAGCCLREEGFEGEIILLERDNELPYQRPPLSKAFLTAKVESEGIQLRTSTFYQSKRIELVRDAAVIELDRRARRVVLQSERSLRYGHLVLATGCRSRGLESVPHEAANVFVLRTMTDARALRERLPSAKRLVVVGAGFIGLELAAASRQFGCDTTVLELGSRPLGRVSSEPVAEFLARKHRETGALLRFNTSVLGAVVEKGNVKAVALSDGTSLTCDILVLGVGVVPETDLAQKSGLICHDGVLVNHQLLTSDPNISAIGDCARHPNRYAGAVVRLESVQNAVDQGRTVAKRLTGHDASYDCLPWFWSDQGNIKLQIAGVGPCDRTVVRGDIESGGFSVFGFRGGRLAVVESINRPSDHVQARRLLQTGSNLTESQASDEGCDLKCIH
jgi:3-phenylpropionate/trans-cinnamate dioxygenase ferredoxin reductase subunit